MDCVIRHIPYSEKNSQFCSKSMILRLKLSHLGENILKSDFSQIWPNCENCNFTKFPAIRYNIFYHIIYYSSCNLALYTSRLTAYIKSFITTFLLTQILIPSRDTTYWCAGFQLPADIQSATKHMIRVRKGALYTWLVIANSSPRPKM